MSLISEPISFTVKCFVERLLACRLETELTSISADNCSFEVMRTKTGESESSPMQKLYSQVFCSETVRLALASENEIAANMINPRYMNRC